MTGTPSKTSVLVIIGEYILALVISLFWSSIHFQKSDQRQIALYIFKGVIGHCDDLCHGAVQHARRLPSQWESSIPSDGEGGAQGTFHEFVFTDFFTRVYDSMTRNYGTTKHQPKHASLMACIFVSRQAPHPGFSSMKSRYCKFRTYA